eukprot:scaffold5075_cov296-Prasinococcus_capsulatus_cf.AAC.4
MPAPRGCRGSGRGSSRRSPLLALAHEAQKGGALFNGALPSVGKAGSEGVMEVVVGIGGGVVTLGKEEGEGIRPGPAQVEHGAEVAERQHRVQRHRLPQDDGRVGGVQLRQRRGGCRGRLDVRLRRRLRNRRQRRGQRAHGQAALRDERREQAQSELPPLRVGRAQVQQADVDALTGLVALALLQAADAMALHAVPEAAYDEAPEAAAVAEQQPRQRLGHLLLHLAAPLHMLPRKADNRRVQVAAALRRAQREQGADGLHRGGEQLRLELVADAAASGHEGAVEAL